jgi:hypothetical protein
MHKFALSACLLVAAGVAQAQDSPFAVTVGARAWYTHWTTFSYYTPPPPAPPAPAPAPEDVKSVALTQVSANSKLVVMPQLSVRWNDFFASVSAVHSARFTFDDGSGGRRSEFDTNVGYSVTPNLAVTLGYKKITQSDGTKSYRPRGPVLGASANAPLGNGLSLYGSLGLGRLKTATGDSVSFKADYRLAEVGLAYALNAEKPRWTLTAGYRIQVMDSKNAFVDDVKHQDGRDTTEGVTIGAKATF